jgi:Bacterial Ig-like domain (group 3)/MBG domain (YGX type)
LFTGTVTSGLAPSDTASSIGLTYTTTATANSTVGQYPITASITSTNYTLSTTPGTLAVTPAVLSVSVNNASRVYGVANPSFTGTVASGLVGSDTASSIGLVYETTATTSSAVGSYPITAGITSANYAPNVTEGSLIITHAASSTKLSVSSTSVTPGQSVTLTAVVASATTGTPTGTVSFYDGTTLLGPATLSGGLATYATTALSAGATNSLTAVYGGDQNFTGSNSSSAIGVAVQPDQFTMTIMHQSVVTVDPGTSAAFEVQLTPQYGSYAGPVSFTARGLPPGATATFSPSLIAANAGPQTVTIIIGIPATTAANQPAQTARRLAPFSLALLLLPFAGSLRRRGRSMITLLCLLAAFAGIAGLTGCGGLVQKQQSYEVTVTATAGSLTQTATFIINVD